MTHKTVVVFESDWEWMRIERDRLRAELDELRAMHAAQAMTIKSLIHTLEQIQEAPSLTSAQRLSCMAISKKNEG
jgi:predicted DNA-binding ribbon-helix-helix protein